MKRVISFLMVLVMLIGVMPIPAGAEEVQETTLLETTAESVPEEVTEASTEPPATSEAAEETQSQEIVETQPSEPVETEPKTPEILSWEEYRYTLLADGTASICGFTGTPEDADKPFLVEIPDAIQGVVVTQIAEKAFAGNDAIKAVLLPETIQVIGSGAFEGCKNLKVLAFCGDAPAFGETLAKGCDKLTEIDVLENRDFSALKELLEEDHGQEAAQKGRFLYFEDGIILKEHVTSLWNDDSREIQPPQEDTSEGIMVAATTVASGTCGENLTWGLDCNGLLSVIGTGNMDSFRNSDLIKPSPWYEFRERISQVVIGNGVTSIGDFAFYSCTALTQVNIPHSVVSIDEGAFFDCGALTSVIIPNGVDTISANTFNSCTSLTSVTIPKSVTSIGYNAFKYCSELTRINIPSSVGFIGSGAFNGCSRLTRVTIPQGVGSIEKGTFEDCSSLTCVTIPDSVTSIGDNAFRDCDSLLNVSIPSSVNSIGSYAFESCAKLTHVTIPSGVTSIYSGAFCCCPRLLTVTIPSSVTYIGGSTFDSCNKLQILYYSGTIEEWRQIYIGPHFTNALRYAEIRYNSSGPNNSYTGDAYVRFFREWDAENKIAHWGKGEPDVGGLDLGSQITEETDTSFLENVNELVGTYVLVESKRRDDGKIGPDTLLSIKPVETRMGIVISASTATKSITIDAASYYSYDWTQAIVEVDDVVMYHLYEGKIVGTVTAQELSMSGIVTKWNADTRQVTIGSGQYSVSPFADATTLDTLGDTGEKKLSIAYFMDDGVVYKARPYATEKPPYNTPRDEYEEEFKHDPAESYLLNYRDKWDAAYNDFITAVGQALNEYAGRTEVKKKHAIEAEAARMKKHDNESSSKYISGDLGRYEDAAYKALATYFYEEVDKYVVPDLSSVDVSKTMAGAQLVSNVLKNIGGNSKKYVINGVKIEIIPAIIAMGTTFGKMVINDDQTVVICSTKKECEETINAYVDDLQDLTTSAIYKVVSSIYKDVLGKSLYTLTEDYLNDVAAKIERRCAVALSRELNLAGVGDLFKSIDTCYTYYTWAKKAMDATKTEDIQQAVDNIINLKFEDTSIKNGAVKSAMKQLDKASNKLNRAFNEHLRGTIVQKEKGFFRQIFGCPVNVAVYNSAGEQIGYIGEDDLWYADNLIINRIGTSKEIIMLDDEIPSFVVTATDYGEMSCSFEECDDLSSPIGRLNFYGVPLTPGQEFTVTLSDNLEANAESIVLESNGEAIHADEYIAVSESAPVSISCKCEGMDNATIYGAGTYVRGDVAVLCVEPQDGFEFIGWYEGGTLVSDSVAYEFIAREDKSLTARFLQDNSVHVDIISGDGGIAVGGGIYNKGRSVYVLALPYNGYTFYGWYVDGKLVSNEAEYCVDVQTDTVLEAKFVNHSHRYADPVFSWTETFTCTASITCASCGTIQVADCTVTRSLVPATESEAGKIAYTAAVTFNGKTYTDTKETPEPSIQIEQEYITLPIGSRTQLSVKAESDAILDMIEWTVLKAVEDGIPQPIVLVDDNGVVSAHRTGTGYVIASITIDGVKYTDRCRVDVTAQESSVAVQGAQLGTTALTTELFKTDYASFDVILLLKQNESRIMSADAISPDSVAPEDNGVAVTSARFEDEQMDALFALTVKDDRTLLVVPRQTAVDNPNTVGKSYSGKVIVNVGGEEFTTDSSLKLTVKKTMPKLKAASLSFNSFYTNQAQPIVITGATVTGISRNTAKDTAKTAALPTWLTLSNGVLALTDDAPAKSASGSAYVLVETEEWAMPIAVAVPVKLAYKAPGLKLSASSATFANAGSSGVSLKLLCSGKADTLSSLNVSGIRAPEGFDVRNFNRVDGSFTLVPNGTIVPGTKNIVVSFGNTDKTVGLKLKVSAKAVTLSAKPGTVTLNSVVGDSAVIPLTASPVDYQITAPTFRLTDSSGAATNQLDFVYSGGTVTIKTNASTRPGATYKLYVAAPGSKEAVITIKTLSEKNSKPTLSAKVTGAIDLSFPESYAAVVPSFRNYSSGLCKLESWTVTESKGKTNLGDATGSFELDYRSGQYRLLANGDLTAGNTYMLTMTFSLADGSTYSCSVKIPVKRTPVKLKLSKTTLSLNKSVEDMVYLGLQCLTKNYDLKAPLISKPENLFVNYRDGRLFVAVNEKTEYGATYRVSVRATQYDAPVTLTVKIPAENKSAVTATLKAAGQLDVVRDSTAITVTPTYKNVLRVPNTYWRMDIYSSADNYATPVTGMFHVEKTESGSFAITRAEGAQINAKLKYRAVLTSKFVNVTVKSSPIALKVTAGSAKITAQASGSALYAADKNSRADFRLIPGDSKQNKILSVRIKNQSDRNLFELFDYGNGNYAVGFKDGEVDKSLMFGKTAITLPLEVILDGNGTPGASIAVSLKFQYAPYAKTKKINLFAGKRDITGGMLEMDTEGACLLTVKSEPANAPRQYIWSSSNDAVATVDPSTYVVYPHGAGEAVLTCTAADGSNVSAKVKIKVTQAEIIDLSICQTYCTGTVLNAENLRMTAMLKNGYEKQIIGGFTCTPSVLNEAGTHTVTVTYGSVEKSFQVEVLDFYELSAEVRNVSGEGYNEDRRVFWVLYLSGRYTGNNTKFFFRSNLPIKNSTGTEIVRRWENAKQGQGDYWSYRSGNIGFGEYYAGCAFCLPDDPTLAGRHSVTLYFGDVTKTVNFTLVYNGDYTSGTGWSVTDVSWR